MEKLEELQKRVEKIEARLETVEERLRVEIASGIYKYVEKTDGCWYWTGPVDRDRAAFYYRDINGKKRSKRALKALYEEEYGAQEGVRSGKEVLVSTCTSPTCVKPLHVKVVSRGEYQRLKRAAARKSIDDIKTVDDLSPEVRDSLIADGILKKDGTPMYPHHDNPNMWRIVEAKYWEDSGK